MAEYIDRDDALNAIERSYWTEGAYERVERLPTADVAPVVHGRWVDGTCTHCGWEAPDYIGYYGYEDDDWSPTPYCPNCGAKMDGEKV